MKKLLAVIVMLSLLPVSFSQEFNFNTEHPLMDLCEKLQQTSFTFESDQFKGTNYENLTEFPPEIIDYINNNLKENGNETQILQGINGITFSAELSYNTTSCFAGSFQFNNSELKFFKLQPDPLAGESEEHITFYVNMQSFEEVIKELSSLGQEDKGPFNVISVFAKTAWKVTVSLFNGDISVKPISGLFKVFDGMRAFLQLPDLGELQDELRNQAMQQSI